MKGNYPDDTFTENDVLACLEGAGLRFKRGNRYILSQCPTHEDTHPSVQIYKDDWFVNCHAGCGRYHITKAFPDLRTSSRGSQNSYGRESTNQKPKDTVVEHKYKTFDLMDFWIGMSAIPDDHIFKGIPIDVLTELGWRYDAEHHRYFIPYFSASMTSIPFAQWRNLGDGPRFNFWKDAKPTMYGTWNLDNDKLFLVEGCSDAAVLEYAGIPWIAAPSAASGGLVKLLAGYCRQNGISLIYAGDNDSAGSALLRALDETTAYRVKQPPPKYKDWGDFLEAEAVGAVQDYCISELSPKVSRASIPSEVTPKPEFKQEYPSTPEEATVDLENVQKIYPDAKVMETVTDPPISKEQTSGPVQPLF